MLIRSQDKTVLKNTDKFYIDQIKKDQYIIVDNEFLYGRYSDKEKAIKVLDMIEKHANGLEKKYIVQDRANPNGYEVSSEVYIPVQNGKISIVFQMPQDEDV